jgi:3-oxoacyl-[acyl-carrier protein] reductase
MFKDKNILLIGGRGEIGKAIVLKYLSLNANVFATISSEENILPYSQEIISINKNYKDKLKLYALNLKNKNEISLKINLIIKESKKIDILVFNSGITKDSLAIRMSDDSWQDVLDINLTSCFILNREILKHMIKNNSGKIVNIASVVAISGNAGQANYTASKAGMISMTKSLSLEVAKRNITLNCISPGFIDTDMTKNLKEDIKSNILSKIPMNKYGSGIDIANGVCFLTSDDASYITGQNLNINGGML